MKIISSIAQDVWHELGNASYEWWYFDAISVDGYALVITFFYGLPFSPYYNQAINEFQAGRANADPGNHTAFYLCLYNSRGTECYALNEHPRILFHADKQHPEVYIGKCSLKYQNDLGYIIKIDAPASYGKHITGEIHFKPLLHSLTAINQFNNDQTDDHIWNCVAPRCAVKGEFKIKNLLGSKQIQFNGDGYHDHNHGIRPMHIDMLRWHWGRLHHQQTTSIFYIIENQDGSREGFLSSIDDQGVVNYCGKVDWQTTDHSHYMGLKYHRSIELSDQEQRLKIIVNNHRAVDEGPFYLRFLSQQQLILDNLNHQAIGFSEAFEPRRLFIKRYWPFIKMFVRKVKPSNSFF